MATRLFLVTILRRETPFFGDEPRSRRHFEPRNPIFWRRALFSSSFWGGKLDFLATRLFLVAMLSREPPFFGDEPCSRRHFEPGNSIFWRRALFSSPFWGEKVVFLAARLVLVVVFRSESRVFGDETLSRRHFEPGTPIFWRRAAFSSPF
ncbi:hypothetical protein [Caldibacillus thermoamylovorans]|uniref:hypothetical protein n=1 Tax=Caldibacillus thermoamylovorans TaxID=35841 RepID=UPI000AAE74B1|nr:hypothetical protein [Caldibacillus thermoamylovorans]